MNLCAYENEEREHGLGAGVNVTSLSDTLYCCGRIEHADDRGRLLGGGTGTPGDQDGEKQDKEQSEPKKV